MTRRAELRLEGLGATRAFGRRLAAALRGGDVVALRGPLGSGKTEVARALIRARAGAAVEVPSPSFTLVQDYAFGDLVIRHIDLYRLQGAAELVELGLVAPEADEVWVIEWPERAERLLPDERLDVVLGQGPTPDARIAKLIAGPCWAERLTTLVQSAR